MKNIELKIFLDDFKKIATLLKKIGARYKERLYQTDTYYNCKTGRLKLREINNRDFELIFYQRPDGGNSKVSNYEISNIKRGQLKTIKSVLTKLLGEKNIIKKQRDLWMYKNTRIHLDKVKKLGKFLELETIVKNGFKEARVGHNEIINLLGLSKYKKYDKSYSDLFLQNAIPANRSLLIDHTH